MAEKTLQTLAGKFIVFDGPDGCGKTTQLKTLIRNLEEQGVKVRRLREPGGTLIGEQIRDLLLSTKNEGMDLHCEMLLSPLWRREAQLVHEQNYGGRRQRRGSAWWRIGSLLRRWHIRRRGGMSKWRLIYMQVAGDYGGWAH